MRYLMLFLLPMLLAYAARSQCPSNKGQLEVAASYGLITGTQVSEQLNNTENADGKTRTYNSGATFLTVRYFLFNRLALGFSAGTQSEQGQVTDRTDPTFIKSTYKESTATVALELYYIYYFSKYIEVYTLAGVGPSFTNTETTVNSTITSPGKTLSVSAEKLKAQYTPVGIRAGGRLGAFLEIGIGYKGLINAGISYKFGSPCWWKM